MNLHQEVLVMDFTGSAQPLSEQGFKRALALLNIGAAEMWAVLSVETHGCGFLQDRRPVILFERHIFHQQTGGVHDLTNPSISSLKPGGYLGGAHEYERLQQAITLDRGAALNSASWGIGQIMGFNAGLAGFDSAEAMLNAMVDSEDAQLTAMANFLRTQKLDASLASHDWSAFVRGYNGPNFKINEYDTRLGASFQKFRVGVPKLSVRQVQLLLMFLGLDPGVIDGIPGKRTRSAVVRFREQQSLGDSDEVDDALIAALSAEVDRLRSAESA
jgi:hypothetical protein